MKLIAFVIIVTLFTAAYVQTNGATLTITHLLQR
jgi:hypothetical protein